ncbi:MAG TPA: HEAT repeat domain-containing protein, partial [Gemmataceae bacterium]|nr:HEAT repeat domain-containing protein [Gemmataceae bacterium]
AAGLVGDTATLARERDTQSRAVQNAFEELAKDLVRVTRDPDEHVRLQAIHSLGRIQSRSAATTGTPLGTLFDSQSTLADRRAAGEALNNLVRILPQVRKTATTLGITGSGYAVEREDRIAISQAVITIAKKGLADSDSEVRRLCADTLLQTALLLSDSDLIAPVRPDIEVPPEGRPLSEAERKEIARLRESVEAERKELRPLLAAFRDLAPNLATAAGDRDPSVRVLVIRALEELGNARQKLLWRAASVPEFTAAPSGKQNGDDQKKKEESPKKDANERKDNGQEDGLDDTRADSGAAIRYAAENVQRLPQFRLPAGDDPLLEGLQKTLRALAEALNDPKPQVRLAAVDTLETMGDDAAPAAPHLAWALSDPDRFVRWAAARTLGHMSPEKAGADKVVPNLIRMLDDPDLDLRVTAAQSLERYGPDAKAAVPALAKSTGKGDPEIRRAAIRALTGIGTSAVPAIPNIATALSHPDVRLRRTAADSLSQFGALAKPAEPALRKALDDTDAEVRRAAADTLLKLR